MSNTLTEIAEQLKARTNKVQLIYAFNGTGKTRLSREFKEIIAPKGEGEDEPDEIQQELLSRHKILYYNAFTEDLFYWDNDLEADAEPKLKIQPNTFTDWILQDQGQDMNVITTFQGYASDKLTPRFNPQYTTEDKDGKQVTVKAFSEVTFSHEGGDDQPDRKIKISKGEESNFIWSVFYSLLDQVISILNVPEEADRETDQFNQLEYVFIDDPVSSLDDNHLIELAVDLSRLIKSSDFAISGLKFIITTHNPLFYNVLHNEFNKAPKFVLRKLDDGNHELVEQKNDSPFSYHLHLKSELMKAAESGDIHKYHFNFLRNVLEKTSTFLGYEEWGELLPGVKSDRAAGKVNPYARVINLYNHAKHAGDEVAEVEEDHKRVFKFLVKEIDNIYKGMRTQQGTKA
ncbi:AAA family ATPase [Vibrio parahaemolyticus]|uniref:AAA family ATPase n=1 Tax=Vibrio TaxID=662 RepID=UPI00146B42CC|nr:AAA family ATPase [Vibrio parahaemolyticus]MDF4755212.1 AAA family ATPase [Vibrio parahaemolyticus]MDF5019363.1 AAA family ATPase [Vibrio parahaemolyticus]MDF5098571.1 AAA family ATPase [Vibrio parahaemolyticus]MDF5183032.1 AAA family ATPase [Vibrio parahaemolyticus]NMS33019.1 AAA family ATPase [Vibrio parahaemolyticus]